MADSKITALTALTSADPANDMIPIVDVSDTPPASGNTKRISINNILAASGTATLASATITGAATVGTTLGVTGVSTLASAVVTGALTSGTTTLVSHAAGYTGKVGIGTATPASALTVVAAAAYPIRIVATAGTTAGIEFEDTTTGSNRPNIASRGIDLAFETNSAEAARFNSTANLVLKGGTTTANGVGVTFPATQAASSDANCLDDYEEGTWTGTLKGSVSDPTVAVTATGKYTKVGRQVTVTIYYNSVSTVGASGNVTIDGLPFAGSESFAGSSITFGLFATSTTLACWNVSTSIAFYITGNFVQATHSPGTGKYLTTTITYFV